MTPPSFNPDSLDSRISELYSLNQQQTGMLHTILEQTQKTNGRVTRLEKIYEMAKGYLAGMAFIFGVVAWFITQYLTWRLK